MRHNKIHAQTIELLLSSITMTMGDDGAKASFFYGRPGTPHWDRRMGADIYYHFVELKLASLFVRSNGPSYLRALAISDITSKLQDFISSNFWYLGDETFAKFRDEPLNQWISEATKDNLADALSNARLRVILQLRGSVVHGRAPDVYDSSKYPKYYKKYKADPISDLELIAAACLRKTVFDDKLLVHVDPNADIIKEAQAAGRLPRRLNNQSILSE